MQQQDESKQTNQSNQTQNDQEVVLNQENQTKSNEELIKDLESAQTEIAEITNAYKRSAADLQNFKRRKEEEQKNLISFANANLILEIIPVLDNFERALEHQPKDVPAEWIEGILQIQNQTKQILVKQGLELLPTIGEKYDPNLHEAMLHCEGEKGIIIQELEKGYSLKGKVIRPAKVSVGNGIAETTNQKETQNTQENSN